MVGGWFYGMMYQPLGLGSLRVLSAEAENGTELPTVLTLLLEDLIMLPGNFHWCLQSLDTRARRFDTVDWRFPLVPIQY